MRLHEAKDRVWFVGEENNFLHETEGDSHHCFSGLKMFFLVQLRVFILNFTAFFSSECGTFKDTFAK